MSDALPPPREPTVIECPWWARPRVRKAFVNLLVEVTHALFGVDSAK